MQEQYVSIPTIFEHKGIGMCERVQAWVQGWDVLVEFSLNGFTEFAELSYENLSFQ